MTTPPAFWTLRGGRFDLSRPRIMGILNVTPDSFSDGGRHLDPDAALRRAKAMVADGADILDIGGESTRPGAEPVPPEEELRRILPVIRGAATLGVPLSVDTRRAAVAEAAIEAGAAAINDVSALGDPGMAGLAASAGAGLVLMHMRGEPRTMQKDPQYGDVVAEVAAFLKERAERAENTGIGRTAIVVDPGIGFGKRLEHNLQLLAGTAALVALGYPVLIGASRKRFIGEISGAGAPSDRMAGSVAAAVAARARGASIFRVHDVAAARQALDVFEAIHSI
jgi:dihydropteroate synthase